MSRNYESRTTRDEDEKKTIGSSTAKPTAEVKKQTDEEKAKSDRREIILEIIEKNKHLDKKDQKEVSLEDMQVAGLMPTST